MKNVLLVAILIVLLKYFIKKYLGSDSRYYNPITTYPNLKKLSDNYDTILEELKQGDWYFWPEKHLWNKPNDVWKVCPLYGFNIWHPKNTQLFPKTCELLKTIPNLRTAVFSHLGPGTRLTPHQGWSKLANKVLRCHMGMIIPKDGRSGVEVEGEFHPIKQREWIVFDDSKYHIGLNESKNEDRIVLLLDIDRPWWVREGKSQYHDMEKLDVFLKQMQQIAE